MRIEQLAFDFDALFADYTPDDGKLYYPSGTTATHCRDCHKKVGMMRSGGSNKRGWWIRCDKCVDKEAAERRANAPRRDCGHRFYYDDIAHAHECLAATCPLCGLSEANGQRLIDVHNSIYWQEQGWDICYFQKRMMDVRAECVACRSYLFTSETCRNSACVNHAAVTA